MIELVEDVLACWRISHLVVADVFPPAQKARDWLLDRLGPDHPASYLVTCVACTGVWAGAGVALARHLAPRWWRPAAKGLAAAAAAPFLEAVFDRLAAG